MKIAIQAADLDDARIDGTRVYILNLLKRFGKIDPADEFLIYHRKKFNPQLVPAVFSNYKIKKISAPWLWTQTRFAWEIFWDSPDVLWMPMQTLLFFRRKKLKTVITIHDLAFKYFPDHFLLRDRFKLNFFTGYAIRRADRIIAVSESTRKDILKFYPEVDKEKIKVIHHGFDAEIFSTIKDSVQEKSIRDSFGIKNSYLFYVGAIQPRKNLKTLIKAFEIYKKENNSSLQLVLGGEKSWLWKETEKSAKSCIYCSDIIFTGKLKFGEIGHLMRGANIFIWPSLYEGFGIPILEAMASGIPVISARNSSLCEVGGEAVEYFESLNPEELSYKIKKVQGDGSLRIKIREAGMVQTQKFSWDKCAEDSINWIRGAYDSSSKK